MLGIRRSLAVFAAAVLAAGALVVSSPSPASAAATCTGTSNQRTWPIVGPTNSFVHGPVLTTTSLCRDINLLSWFPGGVYACVVFVDVTSLCNYSTYVYFNIWTVVATSVKDNVRYRIDIYDPDLPGTYMVHAAA